MLQNILAGLQITLINNWSNNMENEKENFRKCVDGKYVASRLFMSIRTLYNKTSKGDKNLPRSFKIGRKRLYDLAEFEKWFETKKQESQLSFDFDESDDSEGENND
jgi:predicted DNA-binding transcriptional regulator AlpA